MGRFPWGQGQSKQSSDKSHAIPHEWFRKDTESSRPDLMREYGFGSGSDGSPTQQGRSRTNTIGSTRSFYATSGSDASNDLTSRPSSQHSYVESSLPLAHRHDNPAKTLLSKGSRILKRQGSKLSLMPSPTEDTSVGGIEGRVVPLSPSRGPQRHLPFGLQRNDLKKSISTPFAFQHLTHGDQDHFQSIDNVTKTELTSEFIAFQATQRPDENIRGIPVTDLPPRKTELGVSVGWDEPTSPTTSSIPYLPTTPTKPSPPPKDALDSPNGSDIRMSRSMENFSRPTRLSMAGNEPHSPTSVSRRLSVLSRVSQNGVSAKPLPQLPEAIHAVSTTDDIALTLRTAPLPSPPKKVMEVVEEEHIEQVNDMSPPPVLRLDLASPVASMQRRRRSQSSGEIDFDVAFYRAAAAAMVDPIACSVGEEHTAKGDRHISVGMKANPLEDWEDAIDYSWDHAVDLGEDGHECDHETGVEQPRPLNCRREKLLIVEQRAIDETSSSASTPLMMQGARQCVEREQEGQQSSPSRCLDEEPSSPLLGLGIGSGHWVRTSAAEQSGPGQVPHRSSRFDSTDIYRPNFKRSPNSCMSKSSSQESIILSIASSIIGTHRSSNSSTSLSDFTHLANFGGSLDNLKLDLEGLGILGETRTRDASQDTIREESLRLSALPNEPLSAQNDDSRIFTTSPTAKHDRGASAPQVYIPDRKSSMPGVESSSSTMRSPCRTRAGTTNCRPRGNTRVSYSLFPTTSPR